MVDDLSQNLQHKSNNILNLMNLVTTTKILIQTLKESGKTNVFNNVRTFCMKQEIEISNVSIGYAVGKVMIFEILSLRSIIFKLMC